MKIISSSIVVFVFVYLLSFMFVIEMNDWFLIWFGLEMNMLSFLLLMYNRMDLFNIEVCMSYFFVQSLGSVVLIGSYCLSKMSLGEIGPLILSYKMGGGPFFFWFPSVCSGVSWMSCYLLMIFQKFLPMILVMEMMSWSLWLVIVISLLVGVFGSFNQNNVKQLMAFSSIHQIGWMLMCMYMSSMMWIIYFIIYSVVLMIVVIKLMEYKVESLLSISDLKCKMWMVLMMMNIGGIPPMLGFFLKWFSLWNFMLVYYFMSIFMVLLSVVMLYVYIRICYNLMMGENMHMGWVFEYNEINKVVIGFKLNSIIMVGSFMGGLLIFLMM